MKSEFSFEASAPQLLVLSGKLLTVSRPGDWHKWRRQSNPSASLWKLFRFTYFLISRQTIWWHLACHLVLFQYLLYIPRAHTKSKTDQNTTRKQSLLSYKSICQSPLFCKRSLETFAHFRRYSISLAFDGIRSYGWDLVDRDTLLLQRRGTHRLIRNFHWLQPLTQQEINEHYVYIMDSSQICYFLALPVALRIEIYKHLFPTDRFIHVDLNEEEQDNHDDIYTAATPGGTLSMMLSCKKSHAEVSWFVLVLGQIVIVHPLKGESFLDRLGATAREFNTHLAVHLTVDMGDLGNGWIAMHQWPNLEVLDLTCWKRPEHVIEPWMLAQLTHKVASCYWRMYCTN